MWKYPLLGLLGLVLLLLFAPAELEAVWRREALSLRLRLLGFLPIPLLPRKEKPGKGAKKGKAPREESPPPGAEKKGRPGSFLELLQLILDLLPSLAESAGYILRRLTLSRCRIALVISGEDPAETGLRCGRAYALGYSLQAGLRGLMGVREFHLNVLPDYFSGREAADAEVSLRFRPSTLLFGGILLLFRSAGTLLALGRRGAGAKKQKKDLKKAV